jgi:hypothetical protein
MEQKMYQQLADDLYQETCDFINEQLLEIMYKKDLIAETDNTAMLLMNKVLEEYYNVNITIAQHEKTN